MGDMGWPPEKWRVTCDETGELIGEFLSHGEAEKVDRARKEEMKRRRRQER